MRVAPNELEGINGLWRIAIDSQDKKVGESVTKMILQLHTDVDFGMEDQIPVFEDQFITSCFNMCRSPGLGKTSTVPMPGRKRLAGTKEFRKKKKKRMNFKKN